MRRLVTAALWLSVIIGLAFPMVAPQHEARADAVTESAGPHVHDGAHVHDGVKDQAMAPPHSQAVDCEGEACVDRAAWGGCHDGAIHCVTALMGPTGDASLIRLPRSADHRPHPGRVGPHRAPETELPPPRV